MKALLLCGQTSLLQRERELSGEDMMHRGVLLFVLVDWTDIYPGTDNCGGQEKGPLLWIDGDLLRFRNLIELCSELNSIFSPKISDHRCQERHIKFAIFCQTYKQRVHHCYIFSFEVNIGRALTAEAKPTPGNEEADERELHLSSIVAGRHSCSCIQLLLI
ncbi:hypothetical protein CDAR_305881 [Caerostris darwini]|uniref:Uncharacterized protein n=1 Tax=Caerostris darwini TaxID=1538125 RepID=A0AAV4VRM6_9ARAC|nr:hypothetical protein CDAR_305881 [Caerostris darwini]